MKVKAAEGTRCPMEGKPREYITDGKAVTVPDYPYYLRLVADGSLVNIQAPAAETSKKGK